MYVLRHLHARLRGLGAVLVNVVVVACRFGRLTSGWPTEDVPGNCHVLNASETVLASQSDDRKFADTPSRMTILPIRLQRRDVSFAQYFEELWVNMAV